MDVKMFLVEFATVSSQRYKEGRVVLEYALISESKRLDGIASPRNNEEN